MRGMIMNGMEEKGVHDRDEWRRGIKQVNR